MIVVIGVTEKQVIVTDEFNTTPITGKMAMFAKVNAPTETRNEFEIIGVYQDLEHSGKGIARHAAAHPGRKYLQKVCHLDDGVDILPPEQKCIMCHEIVHGGMVYCDACRMKRARELALADPEMEKEPMPIIRATHGPGVELTHR